MILPHIYQLASFVIVLNLDSQQYVTDPDIEYVPVKDLLDKVYLSILRRQPGGPDV